MATNHNKLCPEKSWEESAERTPLIIPQMTRGNRLWRRLVFIDKTMTDVVQTTDLPFRRWSGRRSDPTVVKHDAVHPETFSLRLVVSHVYDGYFHLLLDRFDLV